MKQWAILLSTWGCLSCSVSVDSSSAKVAESDQVYLEDLTSIKIESSGGMPYPHADGRIYSDHIIQTFQISSLSQVQLDSLKNLKVTHNTSQYCIEDIQNYRITTFIDDVIVQTYVDNNCLQTLKPDQKYIDIEDFMIFNRSFSSSTPNR